jgi:hypothetical protein
MQNQLEVTLQSLRNGLRRVLSFVGSILKKSRVWSLLLVSFLVGLRTYQHPLFKKSVLSYCRRSLILYMCVRSRSYYTKTEHYNVTVDEVSTENKIR